MKTRKCASADTRKIVEFLQTSKLVDLAMPLKEVVNHVSKLDEVAGYVIAWERYVLVVSKDIEEEVSQNEQVG